jgi:hypothetical protein
MTMLMGIVKEINHCTISLDVERKLLQRLNWKDITTLELKAFLVNTLYMGMKNNPMPNAIG